MVPQQRPSQLGQQAPGSDLEYFALLESVAAATARAFLLDPVESVQLGLSALLAASSNQASEGQAD